MTHATETPPTYAAANHMDVPFDEINTPGCYVCKTSGTLFRIPPTALSQGQSPVIEVVSDTGAMMAKISDDPWLPITRARQAAADLDLRPNF